MADLAAIVVPAIVVRVSAAALLALALASPWLAEWSGLLSIETTATQLPRVIDAPRPELVLLPGGTFTMGSPEDEPGRRVDELLQPVDVPAFLICRTEVTQGQWTAVMGASTVACSTPDCLARPVEVTWARATEYLDRLTSLENEFLPPASRRTPCHGGGGGTLAQAGCTGFRLPSEAEWEYAARAGTATAHFTGDDPAQLCKVANGADRSYTQAVDGTRLDCDDGASGAAAVASYLPNAWGLHDMHGNVAEWVGDLSGGLPLPGTGHVRGGSYASPAEYLRSASRQYTIDGPAGFRCAIDQPAAP